MTSRASTSPPASSPLTCNWKNGAATLLSRARDVRERAAANGIQAIAWNDPRMPPALLAISDCPPVLWYRGSLECFDAPAVAIIGSRAAAPISLETASRLAGRPRAHAGSPVVSGLARGVDSAAHRGALRSGRTARGASVPEWTRIYPAEHAGLAEQIASAGVVLSEYPPGTPPLPFPTLPMRNRLISGLSRAVVVIEAIGQVRIADHGGVRAWSRGATSWPCPAPCSAGGIAAGHALIRDGAKIVETADDIIERTAACRRPRPGLLRRM